MKRKDYKELIGKKFNRLTLLELVEIRINKNTRTKWKVKCDCGTIKIIEQTLLIHNRTKSCGCLQKDTTRKMFRKEQGQAGFNQIKRGYKRHAKNRNIEFYLTDDQIRDIITKNCFFCNKPPSQVSRNIDKSKSQVNLDHSKFIYNGIDRLNNEKFYKIENSISCCYTCNRMKSDLSYDEFITHIGKIKCHKLK